MKSSSILFDGGIGGRLLYLLNKVSSWSGLENESLFALRLAPPELKTIENYAKQNCLWRYLRLCSPTLSTSHTFVPHSKLAKIGQMSRHWKSDLLGDPSWVPLTLLALCSFNIVGPAYEISSKCTELKWLESGVENRTLPGLKKLGKCKSGRNISGQQALVPNWAISSLVRGNYGSVARLGINFLNIARRETAAWKLIWEEKLSLVCLTPLFLCELPYWLF